MELAARHGTAKTWDCVWIFFIFRSRGRGGPEPGASTASSDILAALFLITPRVGEKIAYVAYAPTGRSFLHLKPIRNSISLFLAAMLVLPVEALFAQASPPPSALHLVVVEGEGFIHNVRQRNGRDPVVRVEDQNQKPLTEAAVVFTLPTEGSSGEFGNGSKTLTIVTGRDGIAKAQGLKVHRVNGKLPIHVTASYRGLTTRTIINQSIEGAPPGATGKSGGSGK